MTSTRAQTVLICGPPLRLRGQPRLSGRAQSGQASGLSLARFGREGGSCEIAVVDSWTLRPPRPGCSLTGRCPRDHAERCQLLPCVGAPFSTSWTVELRSPIHTDRLSALIRNAGSGTTDRDTMMIGAAPEARC